MRPIAILHRRYTKQNSQFRPSAATKNFCFSKSQFNDNVFSGIQQMHRWVESVLLLVFVLLLMTADVVNVFRMPSGRHRMPYLFTYSDFQIFTKFFIGKQKIVGKF